MTSQSIRSFVSGLLLRRHVQQWRAKRELRWARESWKRQSIISREEVQTTIIEAIKNGRPFLAGKVGMNEQNLLFWSEGIKIPTPVLGTRRIHFWNTHQCETNAGLKPRTPESYREFAALLRAAVQNVDLLGAWFQPGELELYKKLAIQPRYYSFYDLDPWFAKFPWSYSLEGKKIFVVSPFLKTFEKQYLRRKEIWPDRNILPALEMDGYLFPYLISKTYPKTWQHVFRDVEAAMQKSDFDIALLGCGALGLPLGHVAKKLGRQAIHLGGMLQILFGVHGQRYRETESYAKMVNSAWTRPEAAEIPAESGNIEKGCYW